MIRLFGETSQYRFVTVSHAKHTALATGVTPYALAFARPSAWDNFFVLIAYTLMTIAFGLNDFSIAYVAATTSVPAAYV